MIHFRNAGIQSQEKQNQELMTPFFQQGWVKFCLSQGILSYEKFILLLFSFMIWSLRDGAGVLVVKLEKYAKGR